MNPGACAASAFDCASSILDRSPAYESGSQARPNAMPKNLLFVSAHIGWGEVDRPVTDQSVIVRLVGPAPTTRSVSFSACALPPGSRLSVLSGLASNVSRKQAVRSIDRKSVV